MRTVCSHDRGTHAESIQAPALYRLFAEVSDVQMELRRCPCLAPVLGVLAGEGGRARIALLYLPALDRRLTNS
jgi:hypothetical protein